MNVIDISSFRYRTARSRVISYEGVAIKSALVYWPRSVPRDSPRIVINPLIKEAEHYYPSRKLVDQLPIFTSKITLENLKFNVRKLL